MIDITDIDSAAAEYVLGTLTSEERAEVVRLRSSNEDLNKAIMNWETRLASLNEITPEIMPSAGLFAKIERRIMADPVASPAPTRAVPTGRVRHWHKLALAASLTFVIISGALIYETPSHMSPGPVAVLKTDAATPLFSVSLDEKNATLIVHALARLTPGDKSFELWFIADGDKTPHSLGVLPIQDFRSISLAHLDLGTIRNATLAISVEPRGGSPTGLPTGPVISTAKFVHA